MILLKKTLDYMERIKYVISMKKKIALLSMLLVMAFDVSWMLAIEKTYDIF